MSIVMFTASMVVTMGLLAGSGRLSRRLESTTWPVAAEDASSSGASAVTVTVSAWDPTWSAMLTLSVSPTRSSSGPCWKFLKPVTSTTRRYWPGIRFCRSKMPSDELLVEVSTLV